MTCESPSAGPVTGFWGSYALGLVENMRPAAAIVSYLEQIEQTLAPFHGAFLVHGGSWHQVEGPPAGDPILIGFPDPDGARDWYRSPAYQQIAPLRHSSCDSRILLIEGVDETHSSHEVTALLGMSGAPNGQP